MRGPFCLGCVASGTLCQLQRWEQRFDPALLFWDCKRPLPGTEGCPQP